MLKHLALLPQMQGYLIDLHHPGFPALHMLWFCPFFLFMDICGQYCAFVIMQKQV